jgi:hypothetical protein
MKDCSISLSKVRLMEYLKIVVCYRIHYYLMTDRRDRTSKEKAKTKSEIRPSPQ